MVILQVERIAHILRIRHNGVTVGIAEPRTDGVWGVSMLDSYRENLPDAIKAVESFLILERPSRPPTHSQYDMEDRAVIQ